ncbi:MAG: tetratricopeptide repeat protein, partial [Planctomycetota bacterium JB042]
MTIPGPIAALLFLPLAFGAPNEGEGKPPPLPDDLRARLDDLPSVRTAAEVDALYDACQLRHGELAPLLERLKEIAAEDDEERAVAAKRILARLRWRQGDLRAASRHLDEVVEAAPTTEDRLARADLLDAAGRTTEAVEAYEALVDELPDGPTRDAVRVRLALVAIDRGEEDPERLAALASAEGRSDEERSRAAVVLGLAGRPADAIELFPVTGEGKARFRAEMRVAEWALRADDAKRAREAAWRAAEAATVGRDRRYAWTVVVEAYRADGELDVLLERFAAAEALDEDARRTWIDQLREAGRVDEALALFRASTGGDGFTVEMRRELLEMCREAERDEELTAESLRLIAAEPRALEWREGLARHHLERGDVDAARALFERLLDDPSFASLRLECAERTRGLGLADLAARFAERVVADDEERRAPAFRFLFELERSRGQLDEAEAVLLRFDETVPADAAARGSLAEAYEQLGRLDRAVEVLEALRAARGDEEFGEDLEMRLAWLHSEVGDEETALERWSGLRRRVESVARRRYVEDRLMTVAARLGRLADVAIELEERLAAGDGTDRDAGLLVRLYTKANDPVSAAEVLEEFMKRKGSSEVAILNEKARIYLACTDYHAFEEVLRELIEIDGENRVEHLRQLAMSQLERGKPDEARDVLARLRELEGGVEGIEFEAGVLALAGLRDEAARAYRRGIAAHPDRIEAYLLLADVLKASGETREAVGMFQYLAEHADQDDLFTIAIDGLLNMEAPPPALKWARRVTLERLAARHEKMVLYRLVADLSEELGEQDDVLDALEAALPIAGERRASLLRELMDLAAGGRRRSGDRERHLRYGRRLVGLAERVPPQVYLELGRAFLENDEPIQAARTFALATDVPDPAAFRAEVAQAFEGAEYVRDALRVVERSLVARPTDVGLIAKVAELHERLGRDEVARPMFSRALDLLLRRRPRSIATGDDEEDRRRSNFSRNVDDWESHSARVTTGWLATTPPGPEVDALLERERARVEEELAVEREDGATLERHPRLSEASAVFRRAAFAFGRAPEADALDGELLREFPDDDELLERLVRERMAWGLVRSARGLVDGSGRPEEERRRVRVLTGAGGVDEGTGTLPVHEVEGLVLPA